MKDKDYLKLAFETAQSMPDYDEWNPANMTEAEMARAYKDLYGMWIMIPYETLAALHETWQKILGEDLCVLNEEL